MMTMTENRLYILALLMFACISANAQSHGLGCVYDPEIDGKVPLRPQLMTRDYTVLPKAYSPSPEQSLSSSSTIDTTFFIFSHPYYWRFPSAPYR